MGIRLGLLAFMKEDHVRGALKDKYNQERLTGIVRR